MSNIKKPEVVMGVKRVPGGWVMVEYHIQGGKIVKEKQTQPDMKVFALERLRKEISYFWDDNEN